MFYPIKPIRGYAVSNEFSRMSKQFKLSNVSLNAILQSILQFADFLRFTVARVNESHAVVFLGYSQVSLC